MQRHNRLSRMLHVAMIFGFIFGCFAIVQAASAQAQSRVNDHDMEALMRNLRDDAKDFRPQFDHAVHRSTIRKTSQEKDAREQVKTFEKQTKRLLDRFKDTRNAQAEFSGVMNSAEQIDRTVDSLNLGPQVMDRWAKIRTELHRIADAYGMTDRFHDRDRDHDRDMNAPGAA